MNDIIAEQPNPKRPDFLLAMYKAMWDNINRHILVVWQSVTALLAAVGALYLSGKDILAPDLATSLVIVASTWAMAHAIDSKGWFNRNLYIITNIERQFLLRSDATAIHPFFVGESRKNTMIEHLRIQAVLGCTMAVLALSAHFVKRVLPTLDMNASVDPARWLPYGVAVIGIVCLLLLNASVAKGYARLTQSAPGNPT
jgi:hypothetical protein